MGNNKLVIAAAGSGKTTHIVEEALKQKKGKVLITTYTQANEREIRNKIIELNKCIPENIIVQTWFSFLLKHGVRPFQPVLFDKKIKGLLLVSSQSGLKYKTANGIPHYYKEEGELNKHYFSKETKIYSDKLSKFVFRCNEKSGGAVINRLSRIYSHIFIDEIQDMAGYDLELLKLLFKSSSNIIMVGDPRQVTYLTHHERKFLKYTDGKIKEFIQGECKRIQFSIDEDTLNKTYRNNGAICDFSSKLFPGLKQCETNNNTITGHDGLFFIRESDIDLYLKQYGPIQLRNSVETSVNTHFRVLSFGESKGLTFDRVLIYPTKPMINWILDSTKQLAPTSRSKLYVAITRAKYSVGFVHNYSERAVEGITNFAL